MTAHAKDALGRTRIAQVLDLPLAVATPKASGTERLVSREDGQVFDLVATCVAAVGAIVADERAIAQQEQIGVGVEEGAARVASEAVDMPSIASCSTVSHCQMYTTHHA